jgi:hypothetical protein
MLSDPRYMVWPQVQTHVQVFVHDRTSGEIPVEKVDQAVPLLPYIMTLRDRRKPI